MMENGEDSFTQYIDLNNRNDIAQYLNVETVSFLTKLDTIWDEIGIEANDRKDKGHSVVFHIKDLFKEILREATDLKNSRATTITNMLKELSELGKNLHIDVTADINGYETMPLNAIISKLDNKIKKYKTTLLTIHQDIEELHSKEDILCKRLGRKNKRLAISPIPSNEELNSYKNYLDGLIKEVSIREKVFSETKIKIQDILKELEIKISLEFEKRVIKEDVSTFILSDDNMKQLKSWYDSLLNEQNDLHNKISDLRDKITLFWERLEESPENRSQFLKDYPGYSYNTLQGLKNEEFRCKQKVKANIKIFIDKMRLEINKWWEKCYYADEQKKEFIHYDSDCYTEDLLTLHEMYINKLKNHFESHKDIYDVVAKRITLWQRLQELEEKAVNPDRLKNRGGQLLREEKERNSVKARLPKVEQKLLELIEKYEEKNKKPFLILGQYVADMIENDWEQFKENRHIQLSAKKQAREQKTPLKSPRRALLSTNSNIKNSVTPRTPKRKIATPLFGSASSKKNKSLVKKSLPKIVVTASTINKRVSLERRKRLERKRRASGKNKSYKSESSTSYNNFELDLQNKSTTCRSTLANNQITNNNHAGPSTSSALPRTPSRTNLRSKSPVHGNNRLTPAAGNFPIII